MEGRAGRWLAVDRAEGAADRQRPREPVHNLPRVLRHSAGEEGNVTLHIARAAVVGYVAQVRIRYRRRYSEVERGTLILYDWPSATRDEVRQMVIRRAAIALGDPGVIEARVVALVDAETDPAGGEPFTVWRARVYRR